MALAVLPLPVGAMQLPRTAWPSGPDYVRSVVEE
jgi:hypothetical protein